MNEFLCINDVFTTQQKQAFENLPVKGEKYTLKEEVVSLIDGKVGYVFYELPNPCHPNGQEYSFRPSRFKEASGKSVTFVKAKEEEAIEM